ncbi:MAG: hypothetical protein ACR2NO_03655 [Chloroflexota bacterium]
MQGLGGRSGLFFGVHPHEEVWTYNQVAAHNSTGLKRLIRACIERGLYLHCYDVALGHHGFSTAHTMADLDWALDRIDAACTAM